MLKHSLKVDPIFVFCFRFLRYAEIKAIDFTSKPSVISFAISNWGGIQSKAFDRSGRRAAKNSLFASNFSKFFFNYQKTVLSVESLSKATLEFWQKVFYINYAWMIIIVRSITFVRIIIDNIYSKTQNNI